ncbi:hypothetical protein RIF29_00234 [Crotalaria pallida]|uniref:Uncharacterized protein n=1 Tax=Crotalaria pallida TaxID=3830 RepID=A0AAN9IVN3_CROPI
MNRWEEWDCEYASSSSSGTTEGGAGAAFPCLQELIINDCPRLRNKLPQRLPSVLKLVIKHCKQLVCSLECASAIREIDLYHCGKLKLEFPFSNNTCYLQTIRVFWSPNVEFEIRHPFNALQRLNLRDSYYSLKALPLDLFPKLQELDLEGCRNLERLDVGSGSGGVTSLTQFSIFGCPKLASFPEGLRTLFPSLTGLWLYDCPEVQCKEEDGGGFPTSLKILEIANCPKLLASRIKWDLHTCTSLTFLIIQDEDGNYADYQGLLPPNLKSLNDRKVGPSSS